MTDILVIDGNKIGKGERKRFEIEVAKLYDQTEMSIPVEVIRGQEDGPTLFISAAIHGDEINGIEVIKRLLSYKKILDNIKGTLIAVPIVNMFGFNRNIRYLPDGRDLNRTFPGSKNGSLAARIAHKFMTEIVEKCEYGIDLHTGSSHRFNLPQIRAFLDNPEIEHLAMACGLPVVIHSDVRDGSLRQEASDQGIKVLLFEGGEALRYDERSIKAAENAIFAIMAEIGMIDRELVKTKLSKRRKVFIARSSHWVRAPYSGSLRIRKALGRKVKKGEILGIISDPFGVERHYVRARKTGIIIGITMLPLVNNGDALFHIATFEHADEVEEELEMHEETL